MFEQLKAEYDETIKGESSRVYVALVSVLRWWYSET